MNIRACKECIHLAKNYGNKNKNGERTVSGYWCVAKNGTIKRFPKECDKKEVPERMTYLDRWVPCSERLPEAGQIVLVTNKYGHVRIFKRIENGWSVPDEGWFTDEEEPDRVKAWMPLPKPYEERRDTYETDRR